MNLIVNAITAGGAGAAQKAGGLGAGKFKGVPALVPVLPFFSMLCLSRAGSVSGCAFG